MTGTQTQSPGKPKAALTMLRTVRWIPVLYRLALVVVHSWKTRGLRADPAVA
jgi:hypothetical protein